MCKFCQEGMLGSMLSGSIGANAHYANIIAGVYLATGQDVACTHESAVGLTYFEMDKTHLIVSIILPCLVTGTVGGGTKLPSQSENLKIMGCDGGNANKFAEILAVTILAGEISLVGALAAGDFTSAHEKFGR